MCHVQVFLLLGFGMVASLSAEVLRVGVSVLPLESVVQAIGGEAVEVRSLQQEGDSCSVFEPRPSSVSWLASAEVFFRTGVGYESAILEKIRSQFTGLRVLDLRQAVELLPYGEHAHDHAAHGDSPACCPHDEETDPHIWVDPLRLVAMTDWIASRLSEARPGEAEGFRSRADAYKARILATHEEVKTVLAPYRGRGFYIYHPALNYFAARYGLQQISLSGPASPPTARDLHRLVKQAKVDGVRTIFVQPQESHRHAQIVAEAIGATLVEIDPMARDCEGNLRVIGRALAESFQAE